jgi:uncharacterized protein (DUF2147 family)
MLELFMSKFAAIAAFAVLLTAIASPALAAPPPDGVWRITSDLTGKPLALIRLETVGGTLVGVLVASLRPGDEPGRVCVKCPGARHNQQIIGMQVLTGLKPDPNNPLAYSGGAILDPDTGNIYQAKLTVSPDGRTVKVHGFIGFSLLGRTQTWRREE